MICDKRNIRIPIAFAMLSTIVVTVGCHQGGTARTTAAPISDYGGTTEGQVVVRVPANSPEATEKGAGASYQTGEKPEAGTQAAQSAQDSQSGTNMVIPLYKESLQVGKRDVNDGSVRIRKYTTTETANQPLDLSQQKVTVGLAPAGGDAAQSGTPQGQAFQQQDVEVQLHHQEPMVSKQVDPGGQVVVQIENDVQHTNVQAEIRREQVQVTKQGNAQNATISPELANPSATSEAIGGGGEVGGQGQGTSATSAPITDPASLAASSDPSGMAGRPAKFSNLKVKQVIGEHLVVLSDSSGKPLYARVAKGAEDLKAGDTVSAAGTINKVPSTASNLGLGEKADQALQGQAIFLDVQQLQPTSP